ncbi:MULTISPECIES: DUF4811 domain-containing protein [Enterococcus]|uniref:Urea transporter n=1 Tax=Enterococcus sulfureus ATCC 49903 TaxID=1140003 RepID=S0NZV8_9ENTE|nr:DUF4811 domain-containing protein [Enterococcus sulfureus]EOT45559.1 hypothetical protein OMY_02138 [Enterococcus sulfureus ATCC 49903]EOT83450.1 hypothetical protein I573_02000 [Enterococcus sulfureus ATCC 49903]
MILVILVISALLFAGSFIFAKSVIQNIIATILGVIFIGSLVLVTLNYSNHFGMEKVTVETKNSGQPLYSSINSDGVDVLMYQPLGDGSEKVYLYNTKKDQKEPAKTGTDHVTNTVKKAEDDQAKLVQNKTYWEYKSDWARLLFGIADNDHELVEEHNTFYLPETWTELTVDQAKAFGELMTKQKDQLAKDGKTYVTEQVMAAMKKNPKLSAAEQKAVTEKATAEFQAQAIQKALAEVKAK